MGFRIGVDSKALTCFAFTVAAALTFSPGSASAQTPPPPAPAPAPAAPPPGYYAPPGGYYAPPAAYAAPPGPRVINDWEEGQAIPPGYHPTTKIRTGLVVGGAVTFGVVYLLTAFTGAILSDLKDTSRNPKLLLIPVAGPFAILSSGTTTGDMFLVIDGLAQAGGLAMLIAGIAAPKTVLVRNDIGSLKLDLLPKPMTFGKTGGGFGFSGTF